MLALRVLGLSAVPCGTLVLATVTTELSFPQQSFSDPPALLHLQFSIHALCSQSARGQYLRRSQHGPAGDRWARSMGPTLRGRGWPSQASMAGAGAGARWISGFACDVGHAGVHRLRGTFSSLGIQYSGKGPRAWEKLIALRMLKKKCRPRRERTWVTLADGAGRNRGAGGQQVRPEDPGGPSAHNGRQRRGRLPGVGTPAPRSPAATLLDRPVWQGAGGHSNGSARPPRGPRGSAARGATRCLRHDGTDSVSGELVLNVDQMEHLFPKLSEAEEPLPDNPVMAQ